MNFHQLTYDSFGLSEDRDDLWIVEETESRLGVALPEAVRQWYARSDAIQLTNRQDRLIELAKLRIVPNEDMRLLEFMIENQGVCWWAVQMESAPNPPVLVNVDGRGWEPHSDTFSDAIFSQVWDWQDYPVHAWADANQLTDEEFASLTQGFRRLPVTQGWPANKNIRLQSEAGSLLLWTSPGMCQFNLRAHTKQGFQELLDIVWKMSDVSQRLDGHDPISNELIANKKKFSAIQS